jgi:hypothetical protein
MYKKLDKNNKTLSGIIDSVDKRREGTYFFEALTRIITQFTNEWAEKLNLDANDILEALEKTRHAKGTNLACYYISSTTFIPKKNVTIFKNQKHMMQVIKKQEFRCPACKEISTSPYTCNSDAKKKIDLTNEKIKNAVCDWSSSGLFGCLDGGFSFTFLENFLEHPRIETIFMPVALEKDNKAICKKEIKND